jgi:hypothetical protein
VRAELRDDSRSSRSRGKDKDKDKDRDRESTSPRGGGSPRASNPRGTAASSSSGGGGYEGLGRKSSSSVLKKSPGAGAGEEEGDDHYNYNDEDGGGEDGGDGVQYVCVQVHSVPLVVRSKLPPDPALRSSDTHATISSGGRGGGGGVGGRGAVRLSESEGTLHSTAYMSFDADGNTIAAVQHAILAPLHTADERQGGSAYGSSGLAGAAGGYPSSSSSFMLQPLVVDSQRMTACCCLPWGRIMTLQVRSSKYSYATDESPKIEWEIISKSQRTVRNISAELVRRTEWKADGHSYESELILSRTSRAVDGTGSKATELEYGVNSNQTIPISIPQSDPSSILICSTINTSTLSVNYFIRVCAHVFPGKGSCCVSNPTVHIPVHLYSRFHCELGLNADSYRAPGAVGLPTTVSGSGSDEKNGGAGGGNSSASAFGLIGGSAGRFAIAAANLPLVNAALQQYLRLFAMYGGLNLGSGSDDNIVTPLCVPVTYQESLAL